MYLFQYVGARISSESESPSLDNPGIRAAEGCANESHGEFKSKF